MNRTGVLKSLDAWPGAPLCRLLGWISYWTGRERAPVLPDPTQVERVLIIRPGGIGDMVILTPVLRRVAAHFSAASIDVICERRNVDILEMAEIRGEILIYDSNPLSFLRRLFRHQYDIVIDTEQFHHFSAIFCFLSGAATRIGFKINPRRNPLYTHLVSYDPGGHEGDQFMKLLAPLELQPEAYRLHGELRSKVPESLSNNTTSTGPMVLIQAGSTSARKLWPAASYAEIARLLQSEHGLTTILVGARKDRSTGEQIARAVGVDGQKILNRTGEMNLRETAALLRQARLFVGPDSGLAHLAVALAVPTVVLFGPSDHLKWGTAEPSHQIVHEELPCSPCFIFGFDKPCRENICMKQIQPADVLNACTVSLQAGESV